MDNTCSRYISFICERELLEVPDKILIKFIFFSEFDNCLGEMALLFFLNTVLMDNTCSLYISFEREVLEVSDEILNKFLFLRI